MKKIYIKTVCLLVIIITATSCVKDDDYAIPTLIPGFAETFPEEQIDFNQTFDFEGWTNFAETGTKLWIERDYQNDGYIQFSSFQSNESSNIGWAITPPIDITNITQPTLTFISASNFVDNPDNKLEIFISNNYNGTDVLAATWTQLTATVADNTTNGYVYIPSGNVDLSSFTGTIHIAFKVTGNGTTLDGLFQVDTIKVTSLN